MSVQFREIAPRGSFFKPVEHAGSVALLIEVKDFNRQVPTNYGPKDTAVCDVSVFATEGQLDTGSPAYVITNTKIQQAILAPRLEDLLGEATVQRLITLPPKTPGQRPAWAWEAVDGEVRDKVAAYVDQREAAVQQALASNDVPDYLK